MPGPVRWLLVLAVVGQIVLLGVLAWGGADPEGPRAGIQRGGDFLSWWAGSVVMEQQGPEHLYDKPAYEAAQDAVVPHRHPYQRAYPPPIFQVLAPLVPLGYSDAARVFILTAPLLWGLGIALILASLGITADPRRAPMWIALGSPTLYMISATGQPGFWVLLLGVGLRLWTSERPWAAGFVWGLICAKPPLAAPLALALLLSRQGRSFGGFVLGGGSLVLVSAAFVGVAPWLDWAELVASGGLGKLDAVPHRHLVGRHLLAYPARGTTLEPILGAAGVGLSLLLAAWAMRRSGAAPSPVDDGGPAKLVCLISACLFATPHLIEYDAGLHAGAFAVSAVAIAGRARPAAMALLVAAWFAPILWPLSRAVRFDLGALVVGLWVVWMFVDRPWAASPGGSWSSRPDGPPGRTDPVSRTR